MKKKNIELKTVAIGVVPYDEKTDIVVKIFPENDFYVGLTTHDKNDGSFFGHQLFVRPEHINRLVEILQRANHRISSAQARLDLQVKNDASNQL